MASRGQAADWSKAPPTRAAEPSLASVLSGLCPSNRSRWLRNESTASGQLLASGQRCSKTLTSSLSFKGTGSLSFWATLLGGRVLVCWTVGPHGHSSLLVFFLGSEGPLSPYTPGQAVQVLATGRNPGSHPTQLTFHRPPHHVLLSHLLPLCQGTSKPLSSLTSTVPWEADLISRWGH